MSWSRFKLLALCSICMKVSSMYQERWLENVDVMEQVQAFGLAQNLHKSVQLAWFNIPMAEATYGFQLGLRGDEPAQKCKVRVSTKPIPAIVL